MSDAPSAIPFRNHFCQPPLTLCAPVYRSIHDLENTAPPHFFFSRLLPSRREFAVLKKKKKKKKKKKNERRVDTERTNERWREGGFFPAPFATVTHSFEFSSEMQGSVFLHRSIFCLCRRPLYGRRLFFCWL